MERIEIRTERLTLEPLGTAHLETVDAYARDIENTRYMCHLPNETREQTLAFLRDVEAEWARQTPAFYEFAVLYGGVHVGAVSVYFDGDVGELGWIVNRRYWGKGLAFEAAKALVEYCVAHRGTRRFRAHCDAENVASYRIMEKLGMVRTGEWGGRRNRSAAADSVEYQYDLVIP